MFIATQHLWAVQRPIFSMECQAVLTLTAISVDRHLALLLGLRYKQFVTLNRTYVIVIISWVLPALLSAMWFWNPSITVLSSIIFIPLCLIISIFSYTKIFLTLRHHQNQVQDLVQQLNETNQLNIARYKKAVSTAIWLQLTLVACYLPYGVATALVTSGGRSLSFSNAWNYSVTLVLFKLVIKPYSFLLEDGRSWTSSEEHNQTGALSLFFKLGLVDQHGEKIKILEEKLS